LSNELASGHETYKNSDSSNLSLSGVRILLAEDNFTHKVLLNHILVSQLNVVEANITYANDGQEAFQLLKDGF
jgi:hypothetical protein